MKSSIARWSVFLLLGLSGGALADNSPILGLDQLKNREKKVQELVPRVQPAIVCITNKEANGTGSGIIINKEGLILTAGHVTQATGRELDIIFQDGRHVTGTALGANNGSDAGLAKIDVPGEYPFVEMGDSNKLALGDWVVALGHPGGFKIDRKPPVRIGRIWRRDQEGGIFSDCTLIGGDSGGPLFDLDGKVIGIHSSINASPEHNRHIAVDTYKGDWDELFSGKIWGDLRMSGADPDRPKLGLGFDTDIHEGGAKISSIASGTPTEKLGFQEGDVITKFDGTNIGNYWALMRELSDREAGKKVKIEFLRGTETKTVELELLTAKAKPVERAEDKPREPKRKSKHAEPQLDEEKGPKPYFGATLDGLAEKPEVDQVAPDSPADKAGLKAGDIISSIDEKDITNTLELADEIRSHKPGDKLSLNILRDGKEMTLKLTLEKK